jgi:hypothetical protein
VSVMKCDGSLLIPFGDKRLLSTKKAGPLLRTNLGIPLVAQKWSLNLRSLMVLLEQLTCILTDREVNHHETANGDFAHGNPSNRISR